MESQRTRACGDGSRNKVSPCFVSRQGYEQFTESREVVLEDVSIDLALSLLQEPLVGDPWSRTRAKWSEIFGNRMAGPRASYQKPGGEFSFLLPDPRSVAAVSMRPHQWLLDYAPALSGMSRLSPFHGPSFSSRVGFKKVAKSQFISGRVRSSTRPICFFFVDSVSQPINFVQRRTACLEIADRRKYPSSPFSQL